MGVRPRARWRQAGHHTVGLVSLLGLAPIRKSWVGHGPAMPDIFPALLYFLIGLVEDDMCTACNQVGFTEYFHLGILIGPETHTCASTVYALFLTLEACHMHRRFNWWRVDRQVESCVKLASYDWIHLLPGHGRPGRVADPADREHQIKLLAERERARGLGTLEFDHSGIRAD